jgi:hypothetical protein
MWVLSHYSVSIKELKGAVLRVLRDDRPFMENKQSGSAVSVFCI